MSATAAATAAGDSSSPVLQPTTEEESTSAVEPSLKVEESQGEEAPLTDATMMRSTPTVSPNTSLDDTNGHSPKLESLANLKDPIETEKKLASSSPAVSPDPKIEPSSSTTEIPAPKTPEPDELAANAVKKPETTLSLDKEEDVSDLEKSPPESEPETIDNAHKNQILSNDDISVRAEPGEEDEDSSNDDSSYFNDPIHLPEPGSGRRYSISSNTSQNSVSRAVLAANTSMGRESDASLSLSEDSDDDDQHPHYHHHHPQNPMYPNSQQPPFPQQPMMYPNPQPQQQRFMAPQQQQQQRPRGVPEVYPKPLTRVHSYNSLVSTSSQYSDDEDSASDTSVRDELQNVATVHVSRTGGTPSGRLSPILGEHPPSRSGAPERGSSNNPFFASPSTVNPSPPTIHQAYPIGHIPHPQPHSMTPEELAAWTAMQSAGYAYDPQRGGIVQAIGGPPLQSQSSDLAYSVDSDQQQRKQSPGGQGVNYSPKQRRSKQSRSGRGSGDHGDLGLRKSVSFRQDDHPKGRGDFKVYWQRWLMLMYMSVLNLLSDWTCYSVAPIAMLTEEAFGNINPEELVVVFLCANGIATACEPIILSRLGLRRTVLFGALLLMIGSIIKSGGMPPIIQADLQKGHGEWRVYLGFFLVGLSQPLYQCTPALLSASWFPERERTMATGVALNANQLGIGFAFIFGTLLVSESDDIPKYFGLLSIISTITFLGTLIQFDDAPPTPPSDTARVMRGSFEVNLPSVQSIVDSVRNITNSNHFTPTNAMKKEASSSKTSASTQSSKDPVASSSKNRGLDDSEARRRSSGSHRRRRQRGSAEAKGSGRRGNGSGANTRRRHVSKTATAEKGFHGLAPAPSPARWGPVSSEKKELHPDRDCLAYPAPSPMMPGRVDPSRDQEAEAGQLEEGVSQPQQQQQYPMMPYGFPGYTGGPQGQPVDEQGVPYNPYPGYPPQYQVPYWDPQYQQYAYFQQQQQAYLQQQGGYRGPAPDPYYQYYSYQHGYPPAYYAPGQDPARNVLPSAGRDEGAEPTITIKPHQLDIDIRDDQILLSTKACLARPGFVHSLVAFTVSGIVINTLSTFMDYLVRLNGEGREYTGIVGGTFQFVIMISSLTIGKVCDKTRAYYSITIGMLVLGAFGLAECGVSLDADRGASLRWSLIVVAVLVGPLQPVSTELGVDVVYPLSENTVLVIQQLFSNLLSAAFIPCFKAMKDFGSGAAWEGATERPSYTFSFYLLIVLHAAATVFFATFNGRYLRFEHEQEKQAAEERRKQAEASRAFHPIAPDQPSEQVPLIV